MESPDGKQIETKELKRCLMEMEEVRVVKVREPVDVARRGDEAFHV